MKRIFSVFLTLLMIGALAGCGQKPDTGDSQAQNHTETVSGNNAENPEPPAEAPDGFVRVKGGTFEMGSPEDEAWRSKDETLHTVTVSDFYISCREVTQEEYEAVTGENPSNFSGRELPVENVSWMEAASYCNARSEKEGLTPVYGIDGQKVSWNRSADGYRLPTEAEWEYACELLRTLSVSDRGELFRAGKSRRSARGIPPDHSGAGEF